jgi:hypothetical protein
MRRIDDSDFIDLLKTNMSPDFISFLNDTFGLKLNAYTRGTCSSESKKVLIFLERHGKYKKGDIRVCKNLDPYTDCPIIVFYEAQYRTLADRYREYKTVRAKSIDIDTLEKGAVLGCGDYGMVHETSVNGVRCAIKYSVLKDEAMKNPFGNECSSWNERNILRSFRSYMRDRVCPNLPLLYESFICNRVKLSLRKKRVNCSAVATLVERADGNLRSYLKRSRTVEELMSCLFQICAGVRFIQKYTQIMNYDIKQENILYYSTTPGGYWTYEIDGVSYSVPNHGAIFIVNDFGTSRSMSPEFQMYKDEDDKTFRLGARYAMVMHGRFVPLVTTSEPDSTGARTAPTVVTWSNGTRTHGSQFRLYKSSGKIIDCGLNLTSEQRAYLAKHNACTNPLDPEFFTNPDLIPPFEYYNDTQDVIRMFTHGKRSTQSGHHHSQTLPRSFVEKLSRYEERSPSSADGTFNVDPKFTLMKYFILSAFKNVFDPKGEPKGEPKNNPIESYCI